MSDILDASRLVLDRWPTTAADWAELIESTNIPPSIIRRGIAFDAAEPISVADGDGVIVLRDLGCPDCGRPVVVVYRPWADEPRRAIEQTVQGGLEALAWHSRHP